MSGTSIRGGSGGIHADVGDMRRTADRLAHTEEAFRRVAGQALRHAGEPALARTAPLSPGSAAHAEITLVDAAGSVTGLMVGVGAQVFLLRARADLFVIADEGAGIAHRVTAIVLAPSLLVGTVAGGITVYVAAFVLELSGVTSGVLTGRIPLPELDDRLRAVPGAALHDTAEVVGGVLSQFPEITELVTGGLPFWVTTSVRRLPGGLEDAIQILQGIAGSGGLFVDRPVRVGAGTCPDTVRPSGGLEGVLAGVTELERRYGSGNHGDDSGVRIIKLDGHPQRWIVEIPGTTSWSPFAEGNPSDATSNLELMRRRGELLTAIRTAMEKAGIQPGDPVLVAGHSQGGIAAAALASDRRQFNITNVLTTGSPVAGMPIPDDVHALSIEHTQDPVPRLDGRSNPDRPNWTTVSVDASGRAGVSPTDPISAHSGALYGETAATIEEDPRLTEDLASFSAFTGGGGTPTDYALFR